MFDQFFEWMAARPSSIALHESLYLWPAIESVHVLTLGVFVGFAAMLDLRLLGAAFSHIPVSKVAQRLLPWTMASFVVMVISGVVVFYANPAHFYHSIFFRAKLLLLVLAGMNAWIFHSGIWLSVATWDLSKIPPRRARIAGAASLLLWASIIFAGRLIAYNWFDCDSPQSAFVTWVSGCSEVVEQ